ncbi:hypothetical protein C4588_01620 [Candidatus Parcubacteria bacterium]|nr:MAG: hypothetical protein C4588_01620 [Candidatus Parcubacteria bacterium]
MYPVILPPITYINPLFEEEDDELEIEIPLDEPHFAKTDDTQCICELTTLFGRGCQCGAMQKELEHTKKLRNLRKTLEKLII